MIERYKGLRLMDAEGLANLVRKLRKEARLSQAELAEDLVSQQRVEHVSREMIRRAEDPTLVTGDRLHTLRTTIIEHFTEQKIKGPFWCYAEELDA